MSNFLETIVAIMENLPNLTLNPSPAIILRRMGKELQPLLIVDNVLSYPEEMKRYAVESVDFLPPPSGSCYPGLNASLPNTYGAILTKALRPLLSRIFGLREDKRLAYHGFLGIATTDGPDLLPLQGIPHFDSTEQGKVAGVHFFCSEPYQGTAFYRHMVTNFETIDAHRVETYRHQVDLELNNSAAPSQHVGMSTENYERIDYVDAVFNRLVVYRASALHAGILAGAALSPDPKDGRLTANSFIEMI